MTIFFYFSLPTYTSRTNIPNFTSKDEYSKFHLTGQISTHRTNIPNFTSSFSLKLLLMFNICKLSSLIAKLLCKSKCLQWTAYIIFSMFSTILISVVRILLHFISSPKSQQVFQGPKDFILFFNLGV